MTATHERRWRGRATALVAIPVLVLAHAAPPARAQDDDGPSGREDAHGTVQQPVRAFAGRSFWNTPLPENSATHPRSEQVIDFLARTERGGCVQLSGAGNDWGMPTYWARPGDPAYAVEPTGFLLPPEFASLRIPRGARPHPGYDREMVVYDLARGYVAFLHRAVYDPRQDDWSAGGGSVAYLGSNGLEARLPESDDPRNTGSQRGLNGAVVAVRHDEVASDSIRHVLKIATLTAADAYEWPLTGTDGTSRSPAAPVQGMRLRIRPEVDLSRFALHPQALVIARALQDYGALVGDSTSARVELKLEDTVSEGRGQLWAVGQLSLCSIPITAFEVVATPQPDPTGQEG